MNQKFVNRLLLAIFISISFIACNDNGKSEEKVTPATPTENTDPTAGKDAVSVSPGLYKVLHDTLGIRMVEATYKPGDSSALHWHPDYAVYAIDGGMATFYSKEGKRMDNEMKQGMTLIKPAEWHSVKNNGNTDIHVMLFEINRNGAMSTPDAATDAAKVAPDVYKVKNDTMGIRVLEITAKPGGTVAMHGHPDAAIYVISGGTTEFTLKDGKKNVTELKTGMGMVMPAGMHSAKNTGSTTLHAILVEVNRAMK